MDNLKVGEKKGSLFLGISIDERLSTIWEGQLTMISLTLSLYTILAGSILVTILASVVVVAVSVLLDDLGM